MNNRGGGSNGGGMASKSFSAWMVEQQQRERDQRDLEAAGGIGGGGGGLFPGDILGTWGGSMLSQFSSVQDSFSSQLQELSGSIPEAGPLSAAFRQRMAYAVYLLCGSLVFGVLAIIIGLPTLILRPSKFVVCMTLSTLLGASSVIVLQKPSIFFASLWSGGLSKSLPVLLLGASMLFTLYVTIFIHRYLLVITCGCAQVLCMLFYLSSFVPGGYKGLSIMLRALYTVISTALVPCTYALKSSIRVCFRNVFQ